MIQEQMSASLSNSSICIKILKRKEHKKIKELCMRTTLSWAISMKDKISAYREKLRSLARGCGKTATGGELISLLCCPNKNNCNISRAQNY
jgi:hypothetical protein